MDIIYNKTRVMEKASGSTRLIELINDTTLTGQVKKMVNEYGSYMYEELGLIAGKERFFTEVENFPGPTYLPPSGTFVVALAGDMVAGCVGIKKFDELCCEMKRMYVRPAYRGKGIGKMLCTYVINWCRKSEYRHILLDTNTEMAEACSLYRTCGFRQIAPYCINENEHPVYMGFDL